MCIIVLRTWVSFDAIYFWMFHIAPGPSILQHQDTPFTIVASCSYPLSSAFYIDYGVLERILYFLSLLKPNMRFCKRKIEMKKKQRKTSCCHIKEFVMLLIHDLLIRFFKMYVLFCHKNMFLHPKWFVSITFYNSTWPFMLHFTLMLLISDGFQTKTPSFHRQSLYDLLTKRDRFGCW